MESLENKIFSFFVIKEDGWYIPTLFIDGDKVGFTQGRTESEVLDMIADCYKTHLNIKVPWYDRWYAKLKRLFNLT